MFYLPHANDTRCFHHSEQVGFQRLLELLSEMGLAKAAEEPTTALSCKSSNSSMHQTQQQLQQHEHRGCCIVYALKRQTVDGLAARLRGAGVSGVASYHAALPAAKRAAVLEAWRAGELQVGVGYWEHEIWGIRRERGGELS
jgi:superfamily II DNA helicase RecQ